MNKKSICAVILARGGSKGIKNKNIVKIKNKPLIYYSTFAASKSKKIDKVFISTDSKIIRKKILNEKISKIQLISRSKKSSADKAQSEIALLEFANKINYEIIVFIQATNIFINKSDIDNALNKFLKNKYNSMLSVTSFDKFIWKQKQKYLKPINYNYKKRPRRQDMKKFFLENGSFYIFYRNGLLKHSNRLHGNIGFYEMEKKSIFEIDDHEDLKVIRKIYK